MAESATVLEDRQLIHRKARLPAEEVTVGDLLSRLECVERTLHQCWDNDRHGAFDVDALELPIRELHVIRKALGDAFGYED